jgi:hypothetical protein
MLGPLDMADLSRNIDKAGCVVYSDGLDLQ